MASTRQRRGEEIVQVSSPAPPTKEALRNQLRQQASKHEPEERRRESARICAQITTQPIWKSAKSILFFWPMPGEPDLLALCDEALRSGKIVAFPKFVLTSSPSPHDEGVGRGSGRGAGFQFPGAGAYCAVQVSDLKHDLAPGQFGIPEPASSSPPRTLNVLDLIFVPGIGFTFAGARLGRGKGYYDRLLSTISGIRCGVAFDWQIVAELPTETHDIRLDCVVTPSQWRNITDQPVK